MVVLPKPDQSTASNPSSGNRLSQKATSSSPARFIDTELLCDLQRPGIPCTVDWRLRSKKSRHWQALLSGQGYSLLPKWCLAAAFTRGEECYTHLWPKAKSNHKRSPLPPPRPCDLLFFLSQEQLKRMIYLGSWFKGYHKRWKGMERHGSEGSGRLQHVLFTHWWIRKKRAQARTIQGPTSKPSPTPKHSATS